MAYTVRFASTDRDREAAFGIRRAVFEVEQNVPRPLDRDVHDGNADHVVAFDDAGRCVGTGRVVRLDTRTSQVGRMAVLAEARCRGVGAEILRCLEHMASLRGVAELCVDAQLPAQRFYASHGYVAEGAPFEDCGVPHVRMRKVLLRPT